MLDPENDFTDKLFQEGASRHDFAYNPAAWAALETELKAERRRRIILRSSLVVLGLLALAGLFWFFVPQAPEQQIPELSSEQAVAAVEISEATTSALTEQSLQEPSSVFAATSTVENQGASTLDIPQPSPVSSSPSSTSSPFPKFFEDEIGKTSPVTTEKLPGAAPKGVEVNEQVSPVSLVDINPKRSETGADPQNVMPFDRGSEQAKLVEHAPDMEGAVPSATDVVAAEMKGETPLSQLPWAALQVVHPTDRNLPALTSNLSVAEAAFRKLSLRVGAGIVNGFVNTDFNRPRLRYAAEVEYRISNKLALGTGLAHNGVCFYADGKSYNMETDWFNGARPEQVDAQCSILEVPLFVSHSFSSNQTSGFYLRGGLLSSFVLDEQYTYTYGTDLPTGVERAQLRSSYGTQELAKRSFHIFGTAQVSAGYQFVLPKGTAVQLESYVQAPVSGVGHAKVNLWSIGLSSYFVLNFK